MTTAGQPTRRSGGISVVQFQAGVVDDGARQLHGGTISAVETGKPHFRGRSASTFLRNSGDLSFSGVRRTAASCSAQVCSALPIAGLPAGVVAESLVSLLFPNGAAHRPPGIPKPVGVNGRPGGVPVLPAHGIAWDGRFPTVRRSNRWCIPVGCATMAPSCLVYGVVDRLSILPCRNFQIGSQTIQDDCKVVRSASDRL